MSDDKPRTETVINLYVWMRDKICAELCPGGRYCQDDDCANRFWGQAQKIKQKTEELHDNR